jgi:hypothetical protein
MIARSCHNGSNGGAEDDPTTFDLTQDVGNRPSCLVHAGRDPGQSRDIVSSGRVASVEPRRDRLRPVLLFGVPACWSWSHQSMELRVLSREAVERYYPERVEICVSISDPLAPPAMLSPGFAAILRARLQRHRGRAMRRGRPVLARARIGDRGVRRALAACRPARGPLPRRAEPLARCGARALRSIRLAGRCRRSGLPLLESVGATGAGRQPTGILAWKRVASP